MGITRRQKVGEGMNLIGVKDRRGTNLGLRIAEISWKGSRKDVKFNVLGVEEITEVSAVSGGPYVPVYDGIRVAIVARGLGSSGVATVDYSATGHYDMEVVED
jgi:hypothetical protein